MPDEGAFLGSTASGAATGFAAGGPPGALVGAGLGLLSGLLKGRKKKNRAAKYQLESEKEYRNYAIRVANARRRARAKFANAAIQARGFRLPAIDTSETDALAIPDLRVPDVEEGGLADMISSGIDEALKNVFEVGRIESGRRYPYTP